MLKTTLLSALLSLLWTSSAHGAPVEKPTPTTCSPCPQKPAQRELTLRLSFAMGGFYSRTTHWIRTDAAVRLALGIRVHPVVVVQVALLNSVERFAPTIRAGVLWYPWRRGLYAKGAVDVVMAGAGAQPGLAAGVGFAWWFRFPLGLYAELEVSGRLTEPRVLELNAVGGGFVYF